MKTMRMIGLIVLGCILASFAMLIGLMAWLGLATGLLIGLLMGAALLVTYAMLIGPLAAALGSHGGRDRSRPTRR